MTIRAKKSYFFLGLAMFFVLCGCGESSKPRQREETWIETTATIFVETPEEGGEYGVTTEYNASESTAVNAEGEKIVGPIQQHWLAEKEPVHEQTVRIKYQQDEPILFQYIDPVKFLEQ